MKIEHKPLEKYYLKLIKSHELEQNKNFKNIRIEEITLGMIELNSY